MSDEITSTSTRALLSVPDPSTTLSVGLFYGSATYSGVSVDTTEHVRLYARGGAAASDVIGQATGQVWLQSMQDVVGLAKKKVMVSSITSTTIASHAGLTIVAGFTPGAIEVEDGAGTLPNAVKTYEGKANIASSVWLAFDAVMLVTSAAVQAVTMLLGGSFSWFGAQSALANVAGATLNIAALGWERDVSRPGIQLFSEGGTLVHATMGSINVFGLGGVMFASPFVSQFALTSARVRGIYRAAMNAVGPIDVAGLLWLSQRSSDDLTIAARTGPLTMRGAKVTLGTPFPWARPPQLPTTTIGLQALTAVTLTSPRSTKLSAKTNLSATAGTDTTLRATSEVKLKCGVFEIKISPLGVKVGNPSTSFIEANERGVSLYGGSPSACVELGASGLSFAYGPGEMKVVPGASITVDGLEMKIQ